jgi:hypothetical protein
MQALQKKFEVAEVAPEVDEEKDFMDKVTEKFEEVKGEVSDMINGVKEEGFGYLTAGCNGSVSAIGMGVAALAVAFIALKKKED